MIKYVSLALVFCKRVKVGTSMLVSAVLSCKVDKQVQGGTVSGKRRYD